MSNNKNNTKLAMADCSKCGIKHEWPVGIRCHRNLNVSAPPADGYSRQDEEVNPSMPSIAQPSTSAGTSDTSMSSTLSTSMAGQVQTKLDLILKKMEDLETKNSELEHKLESRTAGSVTRCVKVTHNLPKPSHKCNDSCTSQHSHHKSHQMRILSPPG